VRVAIGNNKGGSGKTAATVNLAAALAEAGYRVLVVDVDPQANASRRLRCPFDPAHPAVTVSEVIASGSPGVAGQAIVPTGWPAAYAERVSVVPSRYDLENRVSEAGTMGALARLARSLDSADDEFDVTLLDLPPSLGHLTQLGLAAADAALCPVEPEYDSIEGAVRFRDFVASHHRELGMSHPDVLGFLVTRVRANLGAHGYQIGGLPETVGEGRVWEPHIPERTAFKDAADTATPLRLLGGAVANGLADIYAELAARLMKEL